ncbi:hypothetical protein DFH11DRAFT_1859841 [Phellopilus nigrolimitatus]|nr:hypothetical protein DFH11DRAFT_1859841 [Phellopilus nigrolimitatus]
MSQRTQNRRSYTRSTSAFSESSAKVSATGGGNANCSKVYYRLLTYNAPYNSFYPIEAEDDSLSFLHANRIPPPGFASDYIQHICHREGIHASRAKLYTSTPTPSAYSYTAGTRTGAKKLAEDPAFLLVTPETPLRLRPGGCGLVRANPLVLFLDLDPSQDRTHAALPASRLERGGRRVAKAVRVGVGAVHTVLVVCFGTLQKVPKGME